MRARRVTWRAAGAIAVASLLGVTACARLSPQHTASTAAPGPSEPSAPVSLTMLSTTWAGLPTRALVTVNPHVAGRRVVVAERVGSDWRTLAAGTTSGAGQATLSWTWAGQLQHTVRATLLSDTTLPTQSSPSQLLTTADPSPAVATASPQPSVSGVMDAGGQKQFIDCEGSGGPTLVLVSGVWGSSTDWAAQVGIWRTRGRVCTYDRPGLGRSPARRGDQSVDSGMHARELHALLRAAGERGPIILVGHSYGGLIARSYLDLYPSEVAGLALLEAVPAGFQDIYPDYGLTLQDTSTSTVDLDRSSVATGGTAPLNGLPLVVLSADHPESSRPASVAALWTAQQDLLARASRNSLRLIAINSYHQLQVYAPRAVVAAVEALRTSVRTHRLLPGCGPQWAAVGATCFPRTGG